jgi:uncharacterized protein (TIGR02996 family)
MDASCSDFGAPGKILSTITHQDPMDEREALIQTIIDNPEDDVPRLVYADWQEEHGQSAHAELIRVQCELSKLSGTKTEKRKKFEKREEELLNIPEIQNVLDPWEKYERGFVSEGLFPRRPIDETNLETMQSFLDRILTLECDLGIIGYKDEEDYKPFVSASWMNRVVHLTSWDSSFSANAFRHFATCSSFTRLKTIVFNVSTFPVESVADFLLSPHFSSLKEIDLDGDFILRKGKEAQVDPVWTNRVVCQIASSPRIQNWKRLILNSSGIDETGMTAILESPYLDHIERLGFGKAFLSGPLMQKLRKRFGERIRLPENIA